MVEPTMNHPARCVDQFVEKSEGSTLPVLGLLRRSIAQRIYGDVRRCRVDVDRILEVVLSLLLHFRSLRFVRGLELNTHRSFQASWCSEWMERRLKKQH